MLVFATGYLVGQTALGHWITKMNISKSRKNCGNNLTKKSLLSKLCYLSHFHLKITENI